MSYVEERIVKDIIKMIKDNLKILIKNEDDCLYYMKDYCENLIEEDLPIDPVVLTKFTEDALYALLNADFLYDFRDVE